MLDISFGHTRRAKRDPNLSKNSPRSANNLMKRSLNLKKIFNIFLYLCVTYLIKMIVYTAKKRKLKNIENGKAK